MTRIERVLCAIDFSAGSTSALGHAGGIAAWYGAGLALLHVHPTRPASEHLASHLTPAERESLRDRMQRVAEQVPRSVSVALHVTESADVQSAIVQQVRLLGADLIIVGAHGHSRLQHRLGSVAEHLVRWAPRPVLVVPLHAAPPPPGRPPFTRILCATDLSEAAHPAAAYALELAQEADARLDVLHVVDLPPTLPVTVAAATVDARSRLAALVPVEARTYCTAETFTRTGAPDGEILLFAAERQADLIVMGSQGHGLLEHLVFGSHTTRVMRAASCPVLVVPAAIDAQTPTWRRASTRVSAKE
jgi:nucleotide-binding universal stress UspA family protein